MPVDAMDRLELQDKLGSIQHVLTQFHNNRIEEEEAWKSIKETVEEAL